MEFTTLVFYFLATVLTYAALRVVTLKNPVHAALHLVLAFFSASALWMLLLAEFLALVLVLIYVGSLTVLILFVVMMLDLDLDRLRHGFRQNWAAGAAVALVLAAELCGVLYLRFSDETATFAQAAGGSNVKTIGRLLLTEYAYPFELASLILLTGIVAAVALTRGTRRKNKAVDPVGQIAVKAADRLRLVPMRPETPPPGGDSPAGITESVPAGIAAGVTPGQREGAPN